MRLKAISLLLLGVLSLLAPESRAETAGESSADRFLNVYQLNQKGEQLESNKDYAGALRTIKEALGILDDISTRDPKWNTPIVEFRRKRIVDAIARLEPKVGASAPVIEIIPGTPGTGQTSGGILDVPDLTDPPKTDKTKPGNSRKVGPIGDSTDIKDPVYLINKERDELREKVRQAQAEREAAVNTATDLKAKLAKATTDRNKLDDQLRLVTQRSDDAERALMKIRKDKTADDEQKQILEAKVAKYKKEATSLRDDRDALLELRDQENKRYSVISEKVIKATQASTETKKALEEAEKGYTVKLAAMQAKVTKAEGERDVALTQLTEVKAQRDTYKSQVEKLQQNKKDLDKALADNATLMAKLSDAEKQVIQFKADSAQKDVLITELKKEIATVNKQLGDAKKESADYQKKMSELQVNLQSTSEKLAMANTTATTGAADKKRLTEENEILRGIATRQLKQQAGRDQTRKLILAELAKMEVKSKDLLMRIDLLAGPVVKLTPQEAKLFKKPEVQVGDNEIALAAPKQETPEAAAQLPNADEPPSLVSITPAPAPAPVALAAATPAKLTPPVPVATPAKAIPVAIATATPTKTATPVATPALAVATPAKAAPPVLPTKNDPPELAMLDTSRLNKPSSLETSRNTAPASTGGSEPRTEPATGGNVIETGAGASSVPADLQPVAASAKDNFERGNYGAAEKLYETILAKAPTNLYALSNLGVVRFREGKLKLAEESFRKAIAIAPEDAFSRCTLGIIYYSQSRYDEAVNELTKSLAINPKYAAAHNFLGITASQKGWQEAAQKELETATQLDPNYADAHFNLAVVYATQQPANKDNARKFYLRATELGAEKDPSLEALLK